MQEEREITLREIFTDVARDLYSAGKEALPYSLITFSLGLALSPPSLKLATVSGLITQGLIMAHELSPAVQNAVRKLGL